MLAFPNVSGDLFQLTEEILQQGFEGSRQSPRRRIILPLHRRQEAPVQRMLNFFQPGTYVQAHVHPLPGMTETVQVLRGRVGFLLFEKDGGVRETCDLGADGSGLIDIEHGVWHGMVCLAPDTVILETKMGPYDPTNDKVFATWSPPEGDAGCDAFREKLEALFA